LNYLCWWRWICLWMECDHQFVSKMPSARKTINDRSKPQRQWTLQTTMDLLAIKMEWNVTRVFFCGCCDILFFQTVSLFLLSGLQFESIRDQHQHAFSDKNLSNWAKLTYNSSDQSWSIGDKNSSDQSEKIGIDIHDQHVSEILGHL
jgi:hypothetical protein